MVALTHNFRLELSQPQFDGWTAPEPYLGLCCGIRSGKTYFGRNWIVSRVVECPGSMALATANSYSQLTLVTIPNLKEALTQWGLPFEHKVSDRCFKIYTANGCGVIHMRSTDNIDLVRGAEFGTIWVDETRDAPAGTLDVLKGRMSCPRVKTPRLLCTTTPNGFDQFYREFYEEATVRHRFIKAPTRSNPFLRKDYIEALYADYDPQLARQELDADFLVMGAGKVYHQFDRTVHVKDCAYDPTQPIYLCVDFNIGAMGWALAQRRGDGTVEVIAEVFGRDCNIGQAAELVADKWKHHEAGWKLCGDATSDARDRQSGKSDWYMLRKELYLAGLLNIAENRPNSNPRIKDRVNAVNRMLRDASQEHKVRLFIDKKCKELRADFEQVVWSKGEGGINKTKDDLRTHVSDALGYFVHHFYPAQGHSTSTRAA